MTYLPTDEDLAVLKSHSSSIFCRIDLLNENFATIDSLEGLAIDGSLNVDSESDVRRTFNVTLYLGKKSSVSAFTEEEWINKNVRLFIGLEGRTRTDDDSYENIDNRVKASSEYRTACAAYNNLVAEEKLAGRAKYGNIDNINRNVILWDESTISEYSAFFNEVNTNFPGTINLNDYSTVLASDDKIGTLQVAYTPLFEYKQRMVPLTEDQIWGYLDAITEKAEAMTGGICATNLLYLDSKGLTRNIDGNRVTVCNMIGAVEGQIMNGKTLTAADVSAIAGWSADELQAEYGMNSDWVGQSLHDVQDRIIQARQAINIAYDTAFERVSGERTAAFSKDKNVRWYNQGCFSITSNGFVYNSTTNTVQCSCVDLVARLNGDLAGQLTGLATRLEKGNRISPVIKKVYELGEFKKSCIDYWSRTIPYDLDYDTGTTIWQILTELRDLYYPFEMYFDDDVFVCREIPSGFDDPPVLSAELFESLVTADGESATVDYSTVRNCIEVFGATIDADVYASGAKYDAGSNSLTMTVNDLTTDSERQISFTMPARVTKESMNVVVTFNNKKIEYKDGQKVETIEPTIKTSVLYKSITDPDGNDIAFDPKKLEPTKYYVIDWFPSTGRFYFVGQQQSHAMAKLVDKIPTGDDLKKEKEDENCDNLEYVCVNDQKNIDDLYNAKFSIEKIGRRNEILSGGDYENYTTDERAMEVAKYELWKKSRLTDGLTVTTLLIPWLGVNEKLQYAAKYLGGKTPVDWITKSLSFNLGEGTMSITMSRYFPYYPYIVGHDNDGSDDETNKSKYGLYQDWIMEKYFPDLFNGGTQSTSA